MFKQNDKVIWLGREDLGMGTILSVIRHCYGDTHLCSVRFNEFYFYDDKDGKLDFHNVYSSELISAEVSDEYV